MAENSISIQSFLARVLGVRDNSTLSSEITHDDIKQLLPKLARPSFDYILDNPDLVYNGEVYLVEDDLGRVVPYFNPSYVYEETEYLGEFIEEEPKEEIIPNVYEIDLTSLNNYELQNLLHLYAKHNLRGAHRKVREELISRKDSHHASHESREKTLRKSRKNERLDY